MIYSNFTGRVAKNAKVIDGVNGQFLRPVGSKRLLRRRAVGLEALQTVVDLLRFPSKLAYP